MLFLNDLMGLALPLLDKLIPRFENLGGLPQIAGYSQPELVDDIKRALAIDNKVAANRQASSLDYQFF
jgi:hypothetical protein